MNPFAPPKLLLPLMVCALLGANACVTPAPIQVTHVSPTPAVELPSIRELFHQAGVAFRKTDYALAAQRYLALIKRAPESRYANVSRFNAGLSLERQQHYLAAIPLFESLATRLAGSKDAHDALFRVAICYHGVKHWKKAVTAWTRLLKPEYQHIAVLDRMEGHVRRGWAFENEGDVARAEKDYLATLTIHRRNRTSRIVRSSPLMTLAHLRMGRLYGVLVESIKLALPVDRMARELEEKSNYFLKAQRHLLDAVRFHHREHSLAAGFRLGELFESYHGDIMAAERPDELTDDLVGIYLEELATKVRNLIDKAIWTYEKNLALGHRLDHRSPWTHKTQANLTRLRKRLEDEAAQRAAEKLVPVTTEKPVPATK